MELTPMMQQYKAEKERHPDEILFFRLGDFYEMFFDDAILVSKELGLTLTSRSGDVDKSPMCGVPYHAAETYIAKLIKRGHKIAIAEQIGDPKAPGLTKREVIKVITPGTVLSDSLLSETQNNYIALLYEREEQLVLVGADISTGECFFGQYNGADREQKVYDELYRLMMPELLIVGQLSFRKELEAFLSLRLEHCSISVVEVLTDKVDEIIESHFGADSRPESHLAAEAVATLLDYLHNTVKSDLSHLNRLTYLDSAAHLVIDTYTLRNLEITHNLRDGGKKNTLLEVLDFTHTAMGSRMLRKWLEYPLLDTVALNRRYDAVEELMNDFSLRGAINDGCKSIYDFERLLTRIEVGTANARDLVALRSSFFALPSIKQVLAGAKSAALAEAGQDIELYHELADLLQRSIVDEPGLSLREGGIIRAGYNAELDEYRTISHDSKRLLQEIEEREREQTGIKTLKLGYNKVFGYYLEVRHSSTSMVPAHYIRKQTLANAERYITEELKSFETKILGVQEKIINLEYSLFTEIRDIIKQNLVSIQATA